MTSLALPSLEVQGFRGFQDLRIEKLGRVNLIVGKNNIGKSSLLEAIQLYAATDIQRSLWQILGAHDDGTWLSIQHEEGMRKQLLRQSRYKMQIQQIEDIPSAVKYLFFGRKDITGPTDPIRIGPIGNPEQQLQISIDFYTTKLDEEGRSIFQILLPEEYNTAENLIPRFSISLGKNFSISYSLDPIMRFRLLRTEAKRIDVVSIEANGLDTQEIAQLWDKITLTNHEQEVLKGLRIIAPGIEAINLVGQSTHGESASIVKAQGIPKPVPICTLGDGMQRVLGIVLALVNAQNGILLIDGVENGLHYSIQEDLWNLVFQIAHRLNVQVFAATHSWDCITGFQQAARAEENEEGFLIRLEYKKDKIVPIIFDERDLAIITRDRIEVR